MTPQPASHTLRETIRDLAPIGTALVDAATRLAYIRELLPQRAAIAALMATVGVITRQAPPWARVAWPSAGELRQAIGAKNTKQDAHLQVMRFFPEGDYSHHAPWDEHELDALTAAVGWTRILNHQDETCP